MSFTIVYADPPWPYRDKCNAGQRGAAFKYPLMTLRDICSLPVPQITAPNAALFLWATAPMLNEAIVTILSWGFDYKTVAFTWIKKCKKQTRKDFLGMGSYTRANSEFVLLGVRGKIKRIDAGVRQIVRAPVMRHSQKPAEVRDRISQLMGHQSRIELFAREPVPDWKCWGNDPAVTTSPNFFNIHGEHDN
jgi:N6-adenosine-specific RNA methylase IME4